MAGGRKFGARWRGWPGAGLTDRKEAGGPLAGGGLGRFAFWGSGLGAAVVAEDEFGVKADGLGILADIADGKDTAGQIAVAPEFDGFEEPPADFGGFRDLGEGDPIAFTMGCQAEGGLRLTGLSALSQEIATILTTSSRDGAASESNSSISRHPDGSIPRGRASNMIGGCEDCCRAMRRIPRTTFSQINLSHQVIA